MSHRKIPLSFIALAGSFVACGLDPSFAITPLAAQVANNPASTQQNTLPTTNNVYKIGQGVSAPKLTNSIEPTLSEAARNSKASAIVWVNCYVETDGSTSSARVINVTDNNGLKLTGPNLNSPIYKELEQSAVDAVMKYKFKPAKKNGNPVKVQLNITVTFQL
jgi:protein TonB